MADYEAQAFDLKSPSGKAFPVALAESSRSAGVHNLRLGLDVCFGEERPARGRTADLQRGPIHDGGYYSGGDFPQASGEPEPPDAVRRH